MTKSFAGLLEYFVVTFALKEAGYSKETLIHLEEDGQVSVSTRNQRRAAIVSFLGYAREVCPLYANAYVEAQSIKVKKAPKPDKSFLTVDE